MFFRVHRALGHGFLESVHERAMVIALRKAGMAAERQQPVRVYFEREEVGYFLADIVVEDRVLLELKAAAALRGEHEAQLVNYLCCSDIEVGLLLNFGVTPKFSRYVGPAARRRAH